MLLYHICPPLPEREHAQSEHISNVHIEGMADTKGKILHEE
jgi:hypothetical protein